MWDSNQFLLYKLVPKPNGKTDKVPYSPHTLEKADPTSFLNWADLETCKALVAMGLADGVAFSVTPPYFFLDVDSRTDNPTGVDLSGCYYEVSSSGKGAHYIGRYSGPPPVHRCKPPKGATEGYELELYTDGRFCALTFNGGGNPDHDATGGLMQLAAGIFKRDQLLESAEWTSGPCAEWSGPDDDGELIERMLNRRDGAAQVFGGRATLADLWNCNADKLAETFPQTNAASESAYDGNSADMALATHLAFWTGKDCERMWRLIQWSGLMRDKWHREDYREGTILKACGLTQSVLGQQDREQLDVPALAVPVVPTPPADKPILRDGFQFLAVHQQLDLFDGCVYVRGLHRVMIPSGQLLKPDQFRATYGGYTFALDATNQKVTRSAWEAFTESQAIKHPQADQICFKPDLAPGAIIHEDGLKSVNTYVPIDVPRAPGDATPFLNHLGKLLPNKTDRDIVLSYMAACVQHIGVKFQWCPLIQGVEGNGKTLLTRCVARSVGRRYVHMPQADDIGNKFNEWLLGKVFCGIEDIYIPAEKRDVMETLKPMITSGDGIGIQGKGKDQITADICCNFILNSNHKDAVRKTENDRRFAIFYTAQQDADDLTRDGMTGNYMPDLYQWLRSGGYAIVCDYLHTYDIPHALNPATGCHRAPLTSSTAEAVKVSMGGVEQEILEAVQESRPGFAGGWISSVALANMLETMRAARAIPPNKRRDLLHTLGFVQHPALPDGRMPSASIVDGGKRPRLYIKAEHPAMMLTDPGSIAKHYMACQQITAGNGPDGVFSKTN